MAFPADVKLVRVTCGTGYDFSGDPISITLEVTPVLGGSLKRLIHAATGTFMTRDALTFKSDPGSPATFTVPSPAQAETWKDGSGEFFTNWSYSVTVTTRTASGKIQSWIQSFQPVDGQETVDLDLVPDGQIGSPTSAPAPAVTSVNGQSGAVVIDVGEAVTPESVAANLTVEAVDAKLPERLSESALSTAIGEYAGPMIDAQVEDFVSLLNIVESPEIRRVVAVEIGQTPTLENGDLVVRYDRAGVHYFTDFSETEVGLEPAGWSQPWGAFPGGAPKVQSVLDATGGKAMVWEHASSNGNKSVTIWDAVTLDPDRADTEILMRIRPMGAGLLMPNFVIRLDGTNADGNAVRAGYVNASNASVTRYVSGTWNSSAQTPVPLNEADTWYLMRYRGEGTSHRFKIWKESDPEPGWQVVAEDLITVAPGKIGIMYHGLRIQTQIDWVAVATAGRIAAP